MRGVSFEQQAKGRPSPSVPMQPMYHPQGKGIMPPRLQYHTQPKPGFNYTQPGAIPQVCGSCGAFSPPGTQSKGCASCGGSKVGPGSHPPHNSGAGTGGCGTQACSPGKGVQVSGLIFEGRVTDSEEFEPRRVLYNNATPEAITKFTVSQAAIPNVDAGQAHLSARAGERFRLSDPLRPENCWDYLIQQIERQPNGVRLSVSFYARQGTEDLPKQNCLYASYQSPQGQSIDAPTASDGTYPFMKLELLIPTINAQNFQFYPTSLFQFQGQVRCIALHFSIEVLAPGPVQFDLLMPLQVPMGQVFAAGSASSDTEVVALIASGVMAPETTPTMRIRFGVTQAGVFNGVVNGCWIAIPVVDEEEPDSPSEDDCKPCRHKYPDNGSFEDCDCSDDD